ncbi:MAG: hypothetical protein ACM3TU_01165 [Bacillota bacterium]
MKQLIAGIVLILVIGIGGFMYRNALTYGHQPASNQPVACTMEAKVCPDGSSVGRTGPNCTFAACPFPNVEFPQLSLSFAVPNGYAENKAALGSDQTLIAAFEKPSKTDHHAIVLRDYTIPTGKTATSTILENTMYESSGNQPASLNEFATKLIQGRTFYCATVERFEGQVHTVCYLPRATDVLRFEVLEKDVDWTNPALVVDKLPEHQAFYAMLATVQTP